MNKLLTILLFCILPAICFSQPAGSWIFDGTDDYIALSTAAIPNTLNGAMTVELWIKPARAWSLVNTESIFGGAYGPQQAPMIIIDNTAYPPAGIIKGRLQAWWGINDAVLIGGIQTNNPTSVVLPYDGRWHHLAVTRKSSGLPSDTSIFVDGKIVASAVMNVNKPPVTTCSEFLFGGGNVICASFTADELKIWSVYRTTDEINRDMIYGYPDEDTGLCIYKSFNIIGSADKTYLGKRVKDLYYGSGLMVTGNAASIKINDD